MNLSRSIPAVFISAVAASASLGSSLPYDSHGFESKEGYALGSLNQQPSSTPNEMWTTAIASSGSINVVRTGGPGSPQYVTLHETDALSGDYAFAYQTALINTPYSPGSQTIAITWTMTNGTAAQNTQGNVFFGATAIANSNLETVAEAGINSSTGKPFGLTTINDPTFNALTGTYVYQLLLNYGPTFASKTYTLSAKTVEASTFKLIGSSAFESDQSTFAGAALSALALDNTTSESLSTASASIDDFSITVPEPASLALLSASAIAFVRPRRAR